MVVTIQCSMPQFIARCLEEIGLEGRCGMPLRDLFDVMDPRHDVAYRRYAWQVLRSMESQLLFHVMRPLKTEEGASTCNEVDKKLLSGGDAASHYTAPVRKRKWKTTLRPQICTSNAMQDRVDEHEVSALKRRKRKSHVLQPVLPSMRRIAAQKQRRMLSDTESGSRDIGEHGSRFRRRRRKRQGSISGRREGGEVVVEKEEQGIDIKDATVEKYCCKKKETESVQAWPQQFVELGCDVEVKDETEDAPDETRWVLRSPRGFRLGREVDIGKLSYEEAVTSNKDGVLGVVACEEVRLKYLGVQDAGSMDTISPQFDLLEMIGRARARGENAATLANTKLFGDSRKLHYLLDMLIVSNYVVKNIVTADQRRFNIVHLRRFASQFHPSMVSPSATMAWQAFPKEVLANVIVNMMKARRERTCVFADIGRELGFGKRQQEQLRNYFIQQMDTKPSFPLQLFMARCKTGSEFIGRKLWCIRLRDSSSNSSVLSDRRRSSSVTYEELVPNAIVVGRPFVERGIMEQLFMAIQARGDIGATVPELRDALGVPTFKLPYKLAQGLITNYNISVEQVVLGKSTMYRMFVPGVAKGNANSEHATIGSSSTSIDLTVGVRVTRAAEKYSTPKGVDDNDDGNGQPQPVTMKEATRGMVRASTIDRRRNYILKRIQTEKVVSLHQLRTGLIEMERGAEASIMDIRSVHRIVDELVEEKKVTTMDIVMPLKQVLQKAHRKVKCAVLIGYQRDREAIREFIESYEMEHQRKYQANLVDHDNDDYVVITNRQKQRHCGGRAIQEIEAKEIRDQEVVKYNAVSYKLARLGLVKLQKQSRRLGMFFGMMYKCRAFHFMVWNRIKILGARDPILSGKAATSLDGLHRAGKCANPSSLREVTFALKDALDLLSVKEYIQLVGVMELLTDQEETTTRLIISKGGSWDALSQPIAEKIRGGEADRFSKIVRVLLDLRLLQVVRDTSSTSLFNVFQTSDDFDTTVSRVAFATLSGGLFKLKRRVHISVRQGTNVLHRLPSEFSYAYAPGFSCKSKSDHFAGRVPLGFDLREMDDVMAYWKSLRFLSVEGARLGAKSREKNSLSVKLDGALIRSAPLSDHNIYVLKAWVPHSKTSTRTSAARAKAAAGPIQALKRKCIQAYAPAAKGLPQKRRKIVKNGDGSNPASIAVVPTSEVGVGKFRKHLGAKKTRRTHTWTLDEDLHLIDLYLEQVSCRWFIEIPLALQKKGERVAFRSTRLSRTLIAWKELGKVFKKKPVECMLRINDLLEAPAIYARLERAKVTITQMKNPGGEFYEEAAIMRQPRLTALLCRALQVILHDRSSYYSVMADMLMNSWKESEVKLVWRYLWLAGIITRTPQANESKDQKQRGFQVHSKVFEMKSLKISWYTIETFCEAAKYLSFVDENVDEATMIAEENDHQYEQEIGVNMSRGHVALSLSSMVSGFSHLVPAFVAPKKRVEDCESVRVLSVKGLAGHLSQQWDGVFPEDFLKEYWAVKSVFGILDVGTRARTIKAMQAFSDCDHTHLEADLCTHPIRQEDTTQHLLQSLLLSMLTGSAASGMTFDELCERYAASGLREKLECQTPVTVLIQREMNEMIQDGKVLEVNGYDRVRFVLREFSDLWTLHSYRVTNDSGEAKVRFLFDKVIAVVARPWLRLDGSVNTKIAIKLKRKVVNIIMCCPGIRDGAVHTKMRKVVSLQDMRSLLEELVISEVIYARVFRDSQPPVTSIFSGPERPQDRKVDIMTLLPGELRYIDFSRDHLHYFPSVNCMELFGAEACDAEMW
uniref:B-block binding subunit of TFIIIC domain-containing protein n=1 Tax=Peronospora matthiolae TaxID=2874970 RepID=A0AAV1VHC6_9STRA